MADFAAHVVDRVIPHCSGAPVGSDRSERAIGIPPLADIGRWSTWHRQCTDFDLLGFTQASAGMPLRINRKIHETHGVWGIAKRIGTIVGSILGGLVALSVLGAVITYFGLQTETGGRLVRRFAVSQVNKTIAGHLDLGAVEFHGTTLSLRNVILADPLGVPVVRLAGVTIGYGLRGLLARRLDVTSVDMERPEIYLRQDAGGLNLSRAIAARHPKPPVPEKPDADKGKGWQVNLVRFDLRDGLVEFTAVPATATPRAVSADGARQVRLANLAIVAAGRVQTAKRDGTFHLALSGQVDGPGGLSRSPLFINVHLLGTDGVPRGSADVSLGNLVALAARIESSQDGEVRVRSLRLPPSLAAAFVASWPIRVPLVLSGVARMKGDIAMADLTLRGEGVAGSVMIRGDGSITGTHTRNGIRIEAKNVQLSEVFESSACWGGIPATAPLVLALSVAPGSSLLPARLSASVQLEVPRTLLAGHTFGPLHFDAAVNRGMLDRLNLNLLLPGAVLTTDGGQREGKTVVTVLFVATRLATLRAAAVALGTGAVPPLEGAGSLELTALGPRLLSTTGSPARWTVVTKAIVPRLNVGGTRYRGIAFHATLPELTGDHQSADVAVSLMSPLKVSVTLSAKATQTNASQTNSDAPPPGDTQRTDVELLRLAVRYPGTRWSTRRSAHFAVETSGAPSASESRMTLENLALYAGAQELVADAHRDSKNLNFNLQVNALRLQDLPGLEGLGMKVAGLLDASVHAKGDPQRPRVDVRLALRDGRADKYKGLAADVVATLLPNRTVNGTARVRAARLGSLIAEFKGPAMTPPPASAPVAVIVDLTNLQVANFPVPRKAGIKANGIMQAHLEIHGTAGDPRLAVRVTGQKMTIERSAKPGPGEGSGTVEGGTNDGNVGNAGDGVQQVRFEKVAVDCDYASPRLDAKVTLVDDKHGSLRASVSSKILLSEVRAPGRLAIAKRKIVGSLRLKNLNPEAISVFVPALQMVRGQISAAFEIQGTVADPQLGGEMSWKKGELVVIQDQQERQSGAPKTDPADGGFKLKANDNGNSNGNAGVTSVANVATTSVQRPNRPRFSARASGPQVNRR
jgi:translocation and assembly module TamB